MNPENRKIAFEFTSQSLKRESCGLLIIEKGREVFIPCKNISEIDDQFIIDPLDFAKSEDRGEITRVIHSHCYSRPNPSEADLVSCESSNLPWSIVSVPNGEWFDFLPKGYRAPLVGREWSHGILDCYSLIRDYYKETLNIDLPDFSRDYEWWLKGQDIYCDNFRKAGFEEIEFDKIRPHDVVLIQVMSPVVNHGAVYLGNDQILHHLHRRLSGREVFGGYYRKHAIKVLRHNKMRPNENSEALR